MMLRWSLVTFDIFKGLNFAPAPSCSHVTNWVNWDAQPNFPWCQITSSPSLGFCSGAEIYERNAVTFLQISIFLAYGCPKSLFWGICSIPHFCTLSLYLYISKYFYIIYIVSISAYTNTHTHALTRTHTCTYTHIYLYRYRSYIYINVEIIHLYKQTFT